MKKKAIAENVLRHLDSIDGVSEEEKLQGLRYAWHLKVTAKKNAKTSTESASPNETLNGI